ncbi:MAG TPA: SDR family oxidoreductase [Candidatus Eisenbacteria bacterium]|nr:SDR family oxidoreductase [Candidatus Eisenbacteria bacterium]
MTPKPLSGRAALVTGGGRGIGEAAARLLAAAGAWVAVSARSRDEIASVSDSIAASGGRSVAIPCDVTQEEGVRELGRRVRTQLGHVDILVLSAGAAASAPFDRITGAQWDEMMNANAKSAFLCAREFAPAMIERKWGRIIAVASVAGLEGGKYIAHYAASKHAVVGFVRSLAAELDKSGVTVNAICPGYVDTALTAQTLSNVMQKTALSRTEALEAILKTTGQKKLLTPEEVAAEIVELALEESGDLTGRAVAF